MAWIGRPSEIETQTHIHTYTYIYIYINIIYMYKIIAYIDCNLSYAAITILQLNMTTLPKMGFEGHLALNTIFSVYVS